MREIRYNIISSGSQGNAVIIENIILIDCGVPFKALEKYYKDLKLVLLTHIHADHFKDITIKRLAKERPKLRFGCGNWLVRPLIELGVNPNNIDVLNDGTSYGYGVCNIIPFELKHNVPNQGYKIHFSFGKMIYATDTNNLNGIVARHYDLYMIEANYDDEEIKKRIAAKELLGLYCYEKKVLRNHLSKAKCNDFIIRNCGPLSKYIYMHCHDYSKDEEVTDYVDNNSASA